MAQKIQKVQFGAPNLPLKLGSVAISCYILEDQQQVLTKAGFQKALGYDGKSEEWMLDFLSSVNKFYPISGDLLTAYENPILFELQSNDHHPTIIKGITPKTFLETCTAITNAKNDGYINISQLKFAKAAENLLRFLSAQDLSALIDTATGCNIFKENTLLYLQQYLQDKYADQSYQWTKTLPEAFLEKLFEMHQSDWVKLRRDPEHIATALNDVIFSRLPESLLEQLAIQKPKRAYKRKIGALVAEHPELKIYISELTALLYAANDNWNIFLQLLNRQYPKNNSLSKKTVAVSAKVVVEDNLLNSLDQNILKGVQLNNIYKKNI